MIRLLSLQVVANDPAAPHFLGSSFFGGLKRGSEWGEPTMTAGALMIGFMGVAMYANPVLLFFSWVRRLRVPSLKTVRGRIGWIWLGLASAGFLAFVCFCFLGPPVATPAFDRWFTIWLRVSFVVSILTFLVGLAGKGRMRWFVPVSAVATLMSVVLVKILEWT
jgi:hypothetical protein